MCHEWGALYIITSTNKIYQLIEKDLPTKMELLFKKHLYPIAIDLAIRQNRDDAYIKDIIKEYADLLYKYAFQSFLFFLVAFLSFFLSLSLSICLSLFPPLFHP